ncbi:GntR family transcriptional regulator/MocR family aminotransferase [Paenibacillus favisporus]|uniref:GntR family transcriptional regulator/MocR family aminotransferase n=1 Tax=Paenibacillus favisporus TaxID=221028 RepID=A0ABV2FCV2_9BACL
MAQDPTGVQAADTKTRQIYSLLRERIFQGQYFAGMRLPSSRELAQELGVSRTLVVSVYEQLVAEGYLEGRLGSGTYVVDLENRKPAKFEKSDQSFHFTRKQPDDGYGFDGVDFRPSFPSMEHVPRKKWREVAYKVYDQLDDREYGYAGPAGHWGLRLQICEMLLNTKGILCDPEQVVVTAGATQAITLVCKLLLQPGETVISEDPTSTFIHGIFQTAGADIVPVPVDAHGLRVQDIPGKARPRLVFVTPSHQFPFGSILSIGRRMELLEYARNTGCFIIEDDYDSEFRYAGMPVHALRELDAERVIYIGTFSKNLFPALRIGYMVLPQDLVAPMERIKRLMDMHTPTLDQAILARFIADQHLQRHVTRMKRIYSRRRKLLIRSLSETFGNRIQVSGDAAGLHLIAEFSGHIFDEERVQALAEKGVRIYPAEKYAIVKGRFEDKLIMGFGDVAESQIPEGVRRIAGVLRELGEQ